MSPRFLTISLMGSLFASPLTFAQCSSPGWKTICQELKNCKRNSLNLFNFQQCQEEFNKRRKELMYKNYQEPSQDLNEWSTEDTYSEYIDKNRELNSNISSRSQTERRL